MNEQQFIFKLYSDREVSSRYSLPIQCAINNQILKEVRMEKKEWVSPNLIKDIPDYLLLKAKTYDSISYKIINQYPGFSVSLCGIQNISEYLELKLSKRNRKNLFAKLNKLELEQTISYRHYFGEIEEIEFNKVFRLFYGLLSKRFQQKKMYNRYLKDWNKLASSVYSKILKKEASLYVIYSKAQPIGITLNYHLGDLVFSHIQTYDINYSQYNIGDILMLRHLEWCFDNDIVIYDLSMGETGFKLKWCNHQYLFYHQFFYNNKSLKEKLLAQWVILKYRLKQYLRYKKIIGGVISLDKLRYISRKSNISVTNRT